MKNQFAKLYHGNVLSFHLHMFPTCSCGASRGKRWPNSSESQPFLHRFVQKQLAKLYPGNLRCFDLHTFPIRFVWQCIRNHYMYFIWLAIGIGSSRKPLFVNGFMKKQLAKQYPCNLRTFDLHTFPTWTFGNTSETITFTTLDLHLL